MTEEADRELQLSRPSERTASGRREREREKGDRRREVETERRESGEREMGVFPRS